MASSSEAALDSALTSAAKDSTRLAAVGARVKALLPAGGHPNGAYVAREAYETFGPDSLFPGVRNAFAFLRTYAAAERQRGHDAPFSAETMALLDRLDQRYVIR